MKPLLFTASAIALMMGTAACSQAASHAETTPPVAMETAAATPDQVKDEHAADLNFGLHEVWSATPTKW